MAKRQALGRRAVIGGLYDIHTDRICSKNVFATLPPLNAVQIEQVHRYSVSAVSSCSMAQIFSMLKVEGELQLSIASGLCDLKGFTSHLINEAQLTGSGNATQCILFTLKTKKEKLSQASQHAAKMSKNSLKMTGQATHVIEEVTYGVNTFLSLKFDVDDRSPNAKQDDLKALLKMVERWVSGQTCLVNRKVTTFVDQRCKIQVFSDILPVTGLQMQSIENALDYMKSIPQLLNGDFGFPLSFAMISISQLRLFLNPNSKSNVMLCAVPNSLIFQLIKCLEENMEVRRKVDQSFDVLQNHVFCVCDKDIRNISTIKTNSDASFMDFQNELATLLIDVRSGRKDVSLLEAFPMEVEDSQYSPEHIDQMLADLNDALTKVKFISVLHDKGVRYVNKSVLLDDIVRNTLSSLKDVHVLHYSTKSMNANKDQWKKYWKAFLGKASGFNNISVLFDHDFDGSKYAGRMTIDHYKNGKLISIPSVQAGKGNQNETTRMCYAESLEVKPTVRMAKRRAYLKLACPGAAAFAASKPGCSGGTKTWHCRKCQDVLVYGFDDAFYCSCGSASCLSYRFMCDESNHGPEYVTVVSRLKFAQTLRALEPLKELNILLLGETGVGKSTWINSFVNYLTYDTMEDAERVGMRYLIPSSFVMTDDNYQPVEIKMGTAENENNSKGQSTTQMPNSYVFSAGELMVRLIDTPGVGDTRGIEQDKVNFQNVLSHLAHLEDIHGICILLKSNSARMTITFQFCIKELLTHLHKDACKNIVFIFTNARETFYRPGDTFSTLRNLLMENKDIVIQLSKETIYCMDNEAVRFLAATNQGMTFRPEDRTNYSISWKTSVEENERLVQHILSLSSHSTKKTLSLNEARRLILGLTEPLAQISQNIQNNIFLAKNRRDEINGMVKKSKDLMGKLNIPVMDIEAKTIPYPRTVCTSSGCTDAIDIDGVTKVNYKTWCHEHCYLKNVQVLQFPCPELQNCEAMQNATACKECGCSWDVHMHITYECVEVMKHTVDKNVERQLKKEGNSISAVEAFIRNIEQRIASLKHEQEIINKVASKCGSFLKQNAITPYNDSVDEYLQQCIRIQRDLVYSGGSDVTLKGLEKMLASYRQEVNILEMSMKDVTGGIKIGPEDIPKLIGELYNLPINGKTLKAFVDVAMNARQNMALYQEKVYQPPKHAKNAGFLKRAWSNAMKSLGVRPF